MRYQHAAKGRDAEIAAALDETARGGTAVIDKDGWREMPVICTNHDRHRRVRVATVCGWADGMPTTVGLRPRYSFPNPSYKPGGRSRESYQFVCSLLPPPAEGVR